LNDKHEVNQSMEVRGFDLLDERVDEEGVHLAVNILDGDLEAVETPGLGNLQQIRQFETVL
jgi:hypothetical protein